jgi:hypothetical protein
MSASFLLVRVRAHGTPVITAELARKTVFAVVFFTAFGRFLRDIHFPVQPFDRFEGHVPAPFLHKVFNKPYSYRY